MMRCPSYAALWHLYVSVYVCVCVYESPMPMRWSMHHDVDNSQATTKKWNKICSGQNWSQTNNHDAGKNTHNNNNKIQTDGQLAPVLLQSFAGNPYGELAVSCINGLISISDVRTGGEIRTGISVTFWQMIHSMFMFILPGITSVWTQWEGARLSRNHRSVCWWYSVCLTSFFSVSLGCCWLTVVCRSFNFVTTTS